MHRKSCYPQSGKRCRTSYPIFTDFSSFRWSGGDNWEKVPTRIRYKITSQNESRQSLKRRTNTPSTYASPVNAEVIEWGFEVDLDEDFIEFLKLLLDPEQELPSYVSREYLSSQLRKTGKTAIQATADYLVKLKEHVLEQVEQRFEAIFTNTNIEFILTVPAVWSDAAKDATLKAAELAGLSREHNLSMVTEPEAAALYALKTVAGVSAHEGDVYIVCDAGGGTVDLISYEIKSTSPLYIEEAVAGNGDVCGSGLLNIRFIDHVKAKMGGARFEKFVEENKAAWSTCLKHFEDRTKRDFDPWKSEHKTYPIPLIGAPDDPSAGTRKDYLVLSTQDLKDIFAPLVKTILKLVDGQYSAIVEKEKNPKGLILVGGFGSSKHLYQTLKVSSADVDPDFKVIRPLHAWSAVAIGAVIHRLEGDQMVRSRIARSHYGILQRVKFDPDKHPASCREFDPTDEVEYATDQIQWYVVKGQEMPAGSPIIMDFHLTVKDPTLHEESLPVIISDEDEAPQMFSQSRRTRYLCTIPADLESLPRKRWKTHYNNSGHKYMQLDYKIGMTFGAGGLLWDMRVGKDVIGTARANYDVT